MLPGVSFQTFAVTLSQTYEITLSQTHASFLVRLKCYHRWERRSRVGCSVRDMITFKTNLIKFHLSVRPFTVDNVVLVIR